MLKVGQQANVGVRKRRALRTELEIVDLGGRVGATDDIEPLLYVVLVLELSARTDAGSGKELVEVELIELSGARDRQLARLASDR